MDLFAEAKQKLKEKALSLRLDAVGVCALPLSPALKVHLEAAGPVPFAPTDAAQRLDADALLPDARSAAVFLFPYKPAMKEKGNVALYARPRDYHKINHIYLDRLVQFMKDAFPDHRFYALTDTTPLADRWLAWSAGLGFYGRNHCLIHPKYGSWFTIGAILTTLPLPPDQPLRQTCGDCFACVRACPGLALTKEQFYPWRCKSWLTQKKEPLTEEEEQIIAKTPLLFGCDECQRVCPWNRHAAPSPLPEMREDRIPTLAKETLQALSNRAFDKAYRDYAFSWRGKKVLLRNMEIIGSHTKKEHGE